MVKKSALKGSVVVLATIATAAVGVPATAAPTAAQAGCSNYSIDRSWGAGSVNVCWGGGLTSGWTRDKAADGRCVQAVVTYYLSGGGASTWQASRSCPRGDYDNFSHWSPTDSVYATVSFNHL